MYLLLLRYLFLHMALSYQILSFHFNLQDSFQYYCSQGMSSGSELPQLVFIWECLRTVLLDMYQPTAFCPSNFHMRNLLIIYWRSLVQDELLLSCSFQILPLSLTFDSLFIMCLDVGLLSSFYLEFVELLGCSYSCLFSHFGKFWPLFL